MNQTVFLQQYQQNLEAAGWDGLKRAEVKELCEVLGDTIFDVLKQKPPKDKNQVAVVPGVGRFTLRKLPRRKVRNPATGETMWAKATKKVRPTIQKSLRDRVMTIK